ncbi:aspartic peptidase domain-containing protein [Cercophora scortea]|uniref:Aspartic peptidase domain-containing protein n=1 Tax=Cercophora scortea TaxID=314031 RepID=A0AAE0M6Q4_9PEZI|nr:aspartic peptidase domain-containing protein [Cercophora scortea]
MVGVARLLELTIWVSAVHAFYPYPASYDCADYHSKGYCLPSPKRDLDAQPGSGKGFTLDLVQRVPDPNEDPAVKDARAAADAGRLSKKYASVEASRVSRQQPSLVARDNTYSVVTPAAPTGTSHAVGVFQDGTDFSYFVQVKFGSSKKPFYMLLDSGAGNTWVMGSTCQSTACEMHSTFGPADSKTLKTSTNDFAIAYGTGQVKGQLADDTISIGGLDVKMTFGLTGEASKDFTHFPFDGILGLSMNKGPTGNMLQTLKAGGIISTNVFSLTLSRASDGYNNGQITIGGYESSVKNIVWTAIAPSANYEWAIPMGDMQCDGKGAGITGRIAYIDTGTSFAFGPAADVAALHKLIPGAKVSSDGVTYQVPCDSDFEIKIFFSGTAFAISPRDWMSGSGTTCKSNFYGYEVMEGSWLLGDVFLKNVVSIFDADAGKIGFSALAAKPAPTVTTVVFGTTSTIAAGATGQNPTGTGTTVTSPTGSSASSNGSGTASAAGGSAAPETASSPSASAKPTSPAEHVVSNKYVSILCILAAIAMVAA